MRTTGLIFSLSVLALLPGCVQSKHTTVLGTYHAAYAGGVTDSIELWRDGTYQQDVRDRSGRTIEHMGQWRVGGARLVEVRGWMDPRGVALAKAGAETVNPHRIFLAPLADFPRPRTAVNVGY